MRYAWLFLVALSCKSSFRSVDTSTRTLGAEDAKVESDDLTRIDFTANDSPGILSIDPGVNVTLKWSSEGYDECAIAALQLSGTSGSHTLSDVRSEATYTLKCKGATGSAEKQVSLKLKIPAEGPLADLKVNGSDTAINIQYGDAVALTWTSKNATTCILNPGDIQSLIGNKYITNLKASVSYVLSCTGPAGTTSDSVSVNVAIPPAPTVQFRINGSPGPLYVDSGTVLQLVWSSTDADACQINPGNHSGLAGQKTVAAITQNQRYTIACEGPGGLVSHSIDVYLNHLVTGKLDLKVNGQDGIVNIAYGSPASITWTSTNATSCEMITPEKVVKSTSGSENLTSVRISQSILLVCHFNGGSPQYDYVTLVVGSAPMPVVNLKVNGQEDFVVVKVGDRATLSWSSQYATSCILNPGNISGLNTSHTIENLTQTTIFSVICSGAGGNVVDSVVVHVNTGGVPSKKVPTVDLKVNGVDGPIEVAKGSTVTLTWTSSDASQCYVSPGNHQATSGNIPFANITKQTIFTLVCIGTGGTNIDMVTVRLPELVNTDPTVSRPSADLKINGSDGPLKAIKGDTVNITWWSKTADECVLLPGFQNGLSGNINFSNLQQTTIFLLKCTGKGGDFIDQVTVNVDVGNLAPVPDLRANDSKGPLDLTIGQDVTLRWRADYASECMLYPNAIKAVTGAVTMTPKLSQTTAFVLVCQGTGGMSYETLIVNVHKPTPLKLSCSIAMHRNGRHACGPNRYEHWLLYIQEPPPPLADNKPATAADGTPVANGTWGLDRDNCNNGKQTPLPQTFLYRGYNYQLWTNGSAGSTDCKIFTTTFSPLVVSMTSEAIELTAPNSGPFFDLGEGLARHSWPIDGNKHLFLAYDTNRDGNINSVQELFGNNTMGPDGKAAANGFAALAKHDANKDGVINALDPVFHRLQLWGDSDVNGSVSNGELYSLAQKGLRSIDLKYQSQSYRIDVYGNLARESSTVDTASGRRFPVVDYWFIPGETP